NVFTSIASGVITTDAEDVITLCNPAARAILNLEEGRSTGVRLEEVLPLGEMLAGLLRAVREEGRREAVEVEPEVPARGVISLSMRLSPMQELETGRGGVAIVMDDLTEEKQREAQLAAVRRYLPPAMVDNIQSIDMLALGGEQRTISVVSADVRGFSTFS